MEIREYKYHIAENSGKSKKTEEDFSLYGAFPDTGDIKFMLRAPRREGICSAALVLHSDGLSSVGERSLFVPMENESFGYTVDVFVAVLSAKTLRELSPERLFYYHYEIECFEGKLSLGGEGATALSPMSDVGERQLLLYDSDYKTPDFLKGGTMYHVFVDRFYPSGKCAPKKGTVMNDDWAGGVPQYPEYRGAPLKNNEFFGGDLWGIAEKLDYLEKLGVTVLYLSPVFDSASNHKYDTGDYMRVDEMFGGDEALIYLIKKCREKNISVILDGVFNHTGSDSVYFNKYHNYDSVGAYESESSPYHEWYNFFEFPDKYECWWGIDILPRVKNDSQSFSDFVLGKGGVVEKYMKMGVSGFRLDVADELSDSFLERMRRTVRENSSDGALIGEVWEDASCKIAYGKRRSYFSGKQLDSVMNYPLRRAVISFIKDGDAAGLRDVTETIYRRYPKCVSDSLMNFLGTHDTERILTVLGDDVANERTNDELAKAKLSPRALKKAVKLLKCAYTIVAFMYGIPSVFYGDEAGLEGYHDPFCRRPYPWDSQNKELLSYFEKTGKIRKEEKLLAHGVYRVLSAAENLFLFERSSDTERITVAVTRGESFVFCPTRSSKCILTTEKRAPHKSPDGGYILPPFSAHVFKSITRK